MKTRALPLTPAGTTAPNSAAERINLSFGSLALLGFTMALFAIPPHAAANAKIIAPAASASSTNSVVAPSVELVVTSLKNSSLADLEKIAMHTLVRKAEPVFDDGERKALEAMGKRHVARAIKVTVDSEERAMELEAWANRLGLKAKFERNSMTFTHAVRAPNDSVGTTPLDRFFSRQWGIQNTGQTENLAIDDLTSLPIRGLPGEDSGARRARAETMSPARTVTVAVLDTGIDYAHPEFDGVLAEKPGECKALIEYTKCQSEAKNAGAKSAEANAACDQKYATLDTDGNGYPLDCAGWNTTTSRRVNGKVIWGDSNAADANGHGTHVAGIIAAKADGNGVQGIARNTKILPVKVLNQSPTSPARPSSLPSPDEVNQKAARGTGDFVARGLLYAIRSGAQVVNMSLGWPADVESNLMRQMVEIAHERGILVVAAPGNDSTDSLIIPCIYQGVICVASHDPDGAISNFSNFGSGVDIAAPGMNILSTFPTAVAAVVFPEAVGYEIKSGTSMAAPFVAGALARLLEAGHSAQEAYVRVMASARPHRPSTVRPQTLARQYTLSGNLDLARAFEVTPQPLILPLDKMPIPLAWNRTDRRLSLTVPLKNFWTATGAVSIDVRLLVRGRETSDAVLSQSSWAFSSWAQEEIKNIGSSLEILSDRLESEITLELSIHPAGYAEQVRTVRLDVRVPLSKELTGPGVQVLPVAHADELVGASVRTVTAADGRADQDYVAIQPQGQNWKLSLMRETEGRRYEIAGQTTVEAPKGELLLLHRLDLDFNGKSDYVLIYRTRPTPEKKQPSFVFQLFDENLKPLTLSLGGQKSAQIEYANTVSVLPDNFRWMKLGTIRVPAWVARGLTPSTEKKPFDPWDPTPIDVASYKIFYLATDGLRTVTVPKDFTPFAILNHGDAFVNRGGLPIIMVKGDGTDLEYATAEVIDGKLEKVVPLELGAFRGLRGNDLKPVLALSPSRDIAGTGFLTDSYRGAKRLTAMIDHPELSTAADEILDTTISSLSAVDSVVSVAAVFKGERRAGVISQTLYELQYTDLATGETASTSLRRFSFLPGFYFFKLFFPAALQDSLGGADRLPGVYVASGLGLTPGLEVIVPRFTSAGKLEGVVRPAKLRLEATTGCEALGNALPATATNPTRAMFFCGDRFLAVPLEY